MTSPREIMAAAIDETIGDWFRRALTVVDGNMSSACSDAALAALTAAEFEVRRRVGREQLRAEIREALKETQVQRVRDGKANLGSLDIRVIDVYTDAVLAVLDEGQEP